MVLFRPNGGGLSAPPPFPSNARSQKRRVAAAAPREEAQRGGRVIELGSSFDFEEPLGLELAASEKHRPGAGARDNRNNLISPLPLLGSAARLRGALSDYPRDPPPSPLPPNTTSGFLARAAVAVLLRGARRGARAADGDDPPGPGAVLVLSRVCSACSSEFLPRVLLPLRRECVG